MTQPALTRQSGNDAAELTMNCNVLETQRTHLNQEEHALLTELLRPGASIEAVIPEDASPDELWRTLDACSRGAHLLEVRLNRLVPIIGKILLMFKNKPSLYKELGHETYADFMKNGVYGKLGLHRTHAYLGKLIAEGWPQLMNPDHYAKIGPKRLEILNKAGIKGTNPNASTFLATAESMKVSEFATYMEQRGFIAEGEAVGVEFVIHTNRALCGFFRDFFTNPRVQSKVGSKNYDEILEALVQECSVEWNIEGNEVESQRRQTS